MPRRALVGLPAILLAAHAMLAAQVIDRVLASVSGRIVTASDVRAARELGLVGAGAGATDERRAIVERLVERLLVLDEVERYAPPEPREADVRRRYDEIRARFPDADAFQTTLRSSGMDEASLLQWLRNDLRIRAYLDQRFAGVIEPRPEDLEQYVRQVRARPGSSSLSEEDVLKMARELARDERRQALVREWIQGLKRRASINYAAGDL